MCNINVLVAFYVVVGRLADWLRGGKMGEVSFKWFGRRKGDLAYNLMECNWWSNA
jgi:hypothetical protein